MCDPNRHARSTQASRALELFPEVEYGRESSTQTIPTRLLLLQTYRQINAYELPRWTDQGAVYAYNPSKSLLPTSNLGSGTNTLLAPAITRAAILGALTKSSQTYNHAPCVLKPGSLSEPNVRPLQAP